MKLITMMYGVTFPIIIIALPIAITEIISGTPEWTHLAVILAFPHSARYAVKYYKQLHRSLTVRE